MSCSCASYGTYIGSLNCPTIPIPNLGLPCPPTQATGQTDASNVVYTGANLSCSGVLSGDTLDVILGKIDTQICSSLGNIGTYNTYCLAPITTWQQFVETISSFVCTTQTGLTTFTGTTFPAYQATVASELLAITSPGLTLCTASGVVSGDSLNTILTKFSNSICDIYNNQLSLSGVNWSQCFVVSTPPTTIAGGFSTLVSQICQLNTYIQTSGIGGTLPTFNTIGTCLPSPSSADTLVSTVNKLITRTCAAPTFDINALTWGCTTKPSTTTTDLQDAFQSVLTSLTNINQSFPAVYSSDFVVTNVDNTNPCAGKFIALSTALNQDRLVAATTVDTAPGTLQQKLAAGTNVTLDYFINPGMATINATPGASDHKVLSNSVDPTPDYLIGKVESGVTTFGITVVPTLDATTNKVQFNVTVSLVDLFTALLNTLAPGETITSMFCNAVASCPSPCNAPSNVTVTYSSAGTTTTSTTTTTTTT